MNRIEKDPLQARLEITNWLVLAVCLVVSALLLSSSFTYGILLGGFISIINFHWLDRDLRGIFSNLTGKAKSALLLKYYLRLAVTAVVLYILISQSLVDIIGLLVGLSVVVMNIVLTAVLVFSKKNRVEEVL
ncbi:MAG: ATP synthase subunit I [Syntrophaceae bacterium]|nr:ATP synthase subunit I [Syntrophaceae bacterium]